ncbi:MAG TPA: elongation factor P [Patescibacteria group bacterium]|nr:elongation factor P [Patescibacteria group bacterium]
MISVNAGNITKGMYLIYKGEPNLVTKADFMSPGKGAAVMRVKYKSLKTGSAIDFTYKTNEQVEVADVDKKEMEFLYRAGSDVVFMNPKTFDQESVPASLIEDKLGYLIGNLRCWVMFYKGGPIGVALPPNVTLKVTESPNEVAGNRINAPKKTVKLETGIEAQVPIFIKTGEKVMIDTGTGEYLGRVK